jgi:ribonuclease HI
MIKIWFDGAVAPINPGGHGGYGMLVKSDGQILHKEAIYVGRWPTISQNVTEYAGAIAALRYLLREGITEAKVHGDATLIINQLNGDWRIKVGAYVPYAKEANVLRRRLPDVRFIWIPRELNREADDLSQRAVWDEPRVIGFQLDPEIDTTDVIVGARKPPRGKRRKQERQAITNEMMDLFMQKTADI